MASLSGYACLTHFHHWMYRYSRSWKKRRTHTTILQQKHTGSSGFTSDFFSVLVFFLSPSYASIFLVNSESTRMRKLLCMYIHGLLCVCACAYARYKCFCVRLLENAHLSSIIHTYYLSILPLRRVMYLHFIRKYGDRENALQCLSMYCSCVYHYRFSTASFWFPYYYYTLVAARMVPKTSLSKKIQPFAELPPLVLFPFSHGRRETESPKSISHIRTA